MMGQAPVILFAVVVALTGSCRTKDPPIAPVPDGGSAAALDKKPVPSAEEAGLTWIFSKPAEIEFTKSEVTVAQYRSCVEAGKCEPAHFDDGTCYVFGGQKWEKEKLPTSFRGDDQPVACVDWNQAATFCEWAGGRLPTEEEWYAEASNKETREYPWGNQEATCDYTVMDQGGLGCGRNSTWPVCSKERGNSVSGLCDISGNVSEWTSSIYDPSLYDRKKNMCRASQGSDCDGRVVRGGSWGNGVPGDLSASPRFWSDPAERFDYIGFRCERGSQPAPPKKGGLTWVRSVPAGIEFTKSEITVAQYRACVEADRCTAPNSNETNQNCNWGSSARDNHPVNCVDWNQATEFCRWAGGRLPTEEEWEAEASNEGTRQYPWGDQEASCYYAVMFQGGDGCGRGSTWPVCSKENGNSVSGLCDMSGNVWEWMSSGYDKPGYEWRSVVLGGSWRSGFPGFLRAAYRDGDFPTGRGSYNGFRCGRSSQPQSRTPQPAHPVNKSGLTWIKSVPAGIEFTKSEITVAQYRACVDAGKCTNPSTDMGCNWQFVCSTIPSSSHSDAASFSCRLPTISELVDGRGDHPVNCVDWHQANAFCAWAGGRLPTAEEWQAEASNKGTREYPWGNEAPTCDYAVLKQRVSEGCGRSSTWPVCSKKRGNSVSGLCDMIGNVEEWMSSISGKEHDRHEDRGGSYLEDNLNWLRASSRSEGNSGGSTNIGFRCGRSSR